MASSHIVRNEPGYMQFRVSNQIFKDLIAKGDGKFETIKTRTSPNGPMRSVNIFRFTKSSVLELRHVRLFFWKGGYVETELTEE